MGMAYPSSFGVSGMHSPSPSPSPSPSTSLCLTFGVSASICSMSSIVGFHPNSNSRDLLKASWASYPTGFVNSSRMRAWWVTLWITSPFPFNIFVVMMQNEPVSWEGDWIIPKLDLIIPAILTKLVDIQHLTRHDCLWCLIIKKMLSAILEWRKLFNSRQPSHNFLGDTQHSSFLTSDLL